MLDILYLTSSIYLDLYTGQQAGMGNVILDPEMAVGSRNEVAFGFARGWHNTIDLYLIYGTAQTGEGPTKSNFQEWRTQITSLFTLYNKDQVFKTKTGLYIHYTRSFHSYSPYMDPQGITPYATGDNEHMQGQALYGWDFNFDVAYDRMQSSFHNIFYFSGKRIAPNLLAYKPLVGFDWTQQIYFIGDIMAPKFSFVANIQFWFAKKENTPVFNLHDGLGGTKRELLLVYGFNYHIDRRTLFYIKTSGDNNLNRGADPALPKGFRDGFVMGFRHTF